MSIEACLESLSMNVAELLSLGSPEQIHIHTLAKIMRSCKSVTSLASSYRVSARMSLSPSLKPLPARLRTTLLYEATQTSILSDADKVSNKSILWPLHSIIVEYIDSAIGFFATSATISVLRSKGVERRAQRWEGFVAGLEIMVDVRV